MKNARNLRAIFGAQRLEKPPASEVALNNEEAVLLRDWDIDRFFSKDRVKKAMSSTPKKTVPNVTTAISVQSAKDAHKLKINERPNNEHVNMIDANNKIKIPTQIHCANNHHQQQPQQQQAKPTKNTFLSNLLDNTKNHKRQESDSKLSLNFVRGFRREHSDFFPLSKRHSAILGERQNNVISQIAAHRSSAIYSKHNKNNNGEPILTDFVSRAYLENAPSVSPNIKDRNESTIENDANNSINRMKNGQLRDIRKSSTSTTCGSHLSSSGTTITQTPSTTAKTSSPNTHTTLTKTTPTTTTNASLANNKCNTNNISSNNNPNRNSFIMGPRREKTESVISLRNSTNRNLPIDQSQVKYLQPKKKSHTHTHTHLK